MHKAWPSVRGSIGESIEDERELKDYVAGGREREEREVFDGENDLLVTVDYAGTSRLGHFFFFLLGKSVEKLRQAPTGGPCLVQASPMIFGGCEVFRTW